MASPFVFGVCWSLSKLMIFVISCAICISNEVEYVEKEGSYSRGVTVGVTVGVIL
jgi:hypothetical protein